MKSPSSTAALVLLLVRSAASRSCGMEVQHKRWIWFGEQTFRLEGCTILSTSTVTTRDVPALTAALQSTVGLETLDLSQSEIGDAGVAVLAHALKNHATLKFLDLSYCSIGDAGAAILTEALKSNSKIRMLVLRGPPVSSSAQMALDAVVKTDPASRPAKYLGSGAEQQSEGPSSTLTVHEEV